LIPAANYLCAQWLDAPAFMSNEAVYHFAVATTKVLTQIQSSRVTAKSDDNQATPSSHRQLRQPVPGKPYPTVPGDSVPLLGSGGRDRQLTERCALFVLPSPPSPSTPSAALVPAFPGP